MPRPVAFFICALSFLAGIAAVSLGLPLMFSVLPAALLGATLFLKGADVRVAVALALIFVLGSAYYSFDDSRYHAALARVPASGTVEGIIADNPVAESDYQSFSLKTDFGTMLVETTREPAYAYGDALSAKGKIAPPSQNYFSRHLVGIMRNPAITVAARNEGNPALSFLYGVKARIRASFERLVPGNNAALLFGIMFGDNTGFSESFAGALSTSGTRFITAIDGLHMQIMILILFGALAYFLPRRSALFATGILIFAFLALTGFTVSGIRAAFMASIAWFAKETGRTYAPYTALGLAAILLALINPKAVVFDVGFQLSFVAVLSIIFFMPALARLLRISDAPGFLGWRQSFLITLSVQLATAPIVVSTFQTFSITSFAASVLVVLVLPLILGLGFLTALLSFVLYPLAVLASLILAPLLSYVAFIVDFFARIAVLFNPDIGIGGIVAYYALLCFIAYRFGEYGRRKGATV